jgi:hypothetical protein
LTGGDRRSLKLLKLLPFDEREGDVFGGTRMIVPSVNPTGAPASIAPTRLVVPIGAGTPSSPPTPPKEMTTISPWASLLSRLQALAAENPAGLTAVASHLASTVHDAAAKASGDDSAALTKFGDALAKVAKDGDVSALKPAHHHRVHAAKHLNGGTGALLSNLLQEVDAVLGPNASAAT